METSVEEILGALELGVVPVSENVDAALSSLSPSDARKAKRKFRKIWRKWCRNNATSRLHWTGAVKGVTRGTRRRLVAMQCKKKGLEIIGTR